MAVYEVEFPDGVYEVEFPDQPQPSQMGARADESMLQTVGRGVRELVPQTLDFAKSAYNFVQPFDALAIGDQPSGIYDTIARTSPETTARVAGTLGAGAAGAAALAPFGAATGVFAPVAIPALGVIGGALGATGFDLAADAASDTATSMINGQSSQMLKPTDQYVNDLVYNLTQGAALGGAGAVAASVPKVKNAVISPFKTSTAESKVVTALEKLEPNYAQKIDDAVAQNALSPDPFFNQKSLAELIDSDVLRSNERTIARSGDQEFANASGRMKQRAAEQLKYLDEIEQSPTTMADFQDSASNILRQNEDFLTGGVAAAKDTVDDLLNQLPENIDALEAGGMIRGRAAENLLTKKESVTRDYNSVGDGVVDITPAKNVLAEELPNYFREVGAQPDASLAKLIEKINREGEIIPSGEKALLGFDGQPVLKEKPFSLRDIEALRSEALDIAQYSSDLRSKGVASRIAQGLDAAEDFAAKNGDILPDQYERLVRARKGRREQGRVFESAATPTKSVLSKQPYGEFKLPESAVPSKYFRSGEKGSREAIRNYKEAVGSSSDALEPLYRYAAKSFREYATKAGTDGALDIKKARTWINNHSESLSELPELKQSLSKIDEAQTLLNERFGVLKRTQAEVEKSALKQMLEADPEFAITKMLSGSNPIRKTRATVEFLRQRDPDAIAGLRRGVIEHIKKVAVQDERIKGQTLLDNINKLRPVMEKSGLFNDAQIKGFELLYKDKKSELSVQNARMGGGSDTAQNLSVLAKLKGIGTSAFLSAIPGGKYLKFLEPVIKAIPQAKFNSILENALLDPRMARQLARKASDERMARTARSLFKDEIEASFGRNNSPMSNLGTAAKRVAPIAPAATQETITSDKSFPTPEEVYKPSETTLKKKSDDMARTPEFDAKVDQIAANLETDPAHLMKAMAFETGGTFDAGVKNKAGSGATGLIQFMPKTAQGLTGADSKEAAIEILQGMNEVEQLDYVEKYLKPFKGKLNSLSDVYMAILWPKAVGKDSQYALFREGTKAYWQNRGLDLDGDGVITKEEATSKVRNFKV